jgi:uncharacterized membrane protein YGL010W
MTKLAVGAIVTLTISVVYGVMFKIIYPLVEIDTGLALGFALVGLLTYICLKAIFLRVRRMGTDRDRRSAT